MKLSKKKLAVIMYSMALLTATVLTTTKQERRYAVRPMNLERRKFGHFFQLVKFMKKNDVEQFFKYTRMTPQLFDYLLKLIEPHISKIARQNTISAEQRLTITLHYLSEGCSMQQIAWDFYIGKSTVHYIVVETCQAIWQHLAPIYLPSPTLEEFVEISDGFFKRWNMPNCIGAVDGKHVEIQSPQYSGSDFFNYKKSFSIILMASCDAFYKFNMVDIGAAGSNHDSYVFKSSGFGEALMQGKLSIPGDRALPYTNVFLPHYLVGDQAFPLHKNIMRPYPGAYLGDMKNIFNYRLSRARRTIENTFGILVQRWRILRRPIIAHVETCEHIVKATVVLHNFVQKSESDIPENERNYCPTGYADYEDDNGGFHLGKWREEGNTLRSIGRIGANNASRTVQQNRDLLADFFVSLEGSVPWQLENVHKGSIP